MMLIITLVVFAIFAGLTVIDSKKSIILFKLPERIRLIPTSTQQFSTLNLEALERYTNAFIEMGFQQLGDYKLVDDKVKLLPTFSRYFYHPKFQCLAVANQTFIDGLIRINDFTTMRGTIMSYLEGGWSYQTTDRIPSGWFYAMRTPKSLWSSFPLATPKELMQLHLEKRNNILNNIKTMVINVPSINECNSLEFERALEKKSYFQNKSAIIFLLETYYYEKKIESEWMG